jgi:carbohydrate-selective porin OprB
MYRRILTLMAAGLLFFLAGNVVFAAETVELGEEIEAMKRRIDHLQEVYLQDKDSDYQVGLEQKWYDKIELAIGMTGVVQGIFEVDENINSDEDITDATMSYDIEFYAPLGSSAFYSLLEAGEGNGVDGDVPTFSGFNDDADDDNNLRLSELWYEHIWSGGDFWARAGKVDLTANFDLNEVANSETDQFLSAGFINNLAAEFPDDNGFGAMLWASPAENWDVGVGIADANAKWDTVLEDAFAIAEVDFKPTIMGREGNYRIYSWFNGKDHQQITDPTGSLKDNYGFGFSADQQLTETLTAFARYGWQREIVSSIEHTVSGGIQLSGESYGRSEDVLGFAYGMAILGDDQEEDYRNSGIDPSDEHHLELYYNLKTTEYLNISPDIQWVKNPEGNEDHDDLWTVAVRTQLNF